MGLGLAMRAGSGAELWGWGLELNCEGGVWGLSCGGGVWGLSCEGGVLG